MLLVVMMLIYGHFLITNHVEPSELAINDTAQAAQTRIAAERIANSIKEVSASFGDAKKTVHINMPSDSELICNPPEMNFNVLEEDSVSIKYSGVVNAGTSFTCLPGSGVNLKGPYSVEIIKTGSGTNVIFNG